MLKKPLIDFYGLHSKFSIYNHYSSMQMRIPNRVLLKKGNLPIFLIVALPLAGICIFWDFESSSEWIELRLALILSVLLVIVGAIIVQAHMKRNGILLDGYVLIWVSFILVYLVSAVCHLGNAKGRLRGFYDTVQAGHIYYSLAIVIIAFVGLKAGLGTASSQTQEPPPQLKSHLRVILVLGILFTAIPTLATLRLFGHIPTLQMLFTVNRSMETGEGTARYIFMSQWLSWGVTFLTIYFLHSPAAKSRVNSLCWFIFAAILIIVSVFWSGSRVSGVMSLLPGLLVLQRLRPAYMKIAVVSVGILILIYFSACTYLRSNTFADYGLFEHVTAVFDWHMGRFSMVGLGIEIVDSQGMGKGTTLFSGLINAINAPSFLLRLPPIIQAPQSITSVVGEYLLGSPDVNGIVPGTILEFYYNFGLVGVAAGYFLIGKLVRKTVNAMARTSSIGLFMVLAYVVVTISAFCIPGTATSWIYYLITTGFPAICFYLCERFLGNHRWDIR